MATITYHTNDGILTGQSIGPVSTFLRGQMDWFSQYVDGRQTRYEGWFVTNMSSQPHPYFKILERFEVVGEGSAQAATLFDDQTQTNYSNGFQLHTAIAPDRHAGGALVLAGNRPFTSRLYLDMRGIYLNPEMDRHYEIVPFNDGLLVHYIDPTLKGRHLFLHIRSSEPIRPQPEWELVEYPHDAARNSEPSHQYVYCLDGIRCQRLNLGIGFSADVAVANSAAAMGIKLKQPSNQATCKAESAATYLATQAIRHLKTPDGYYAGLPWFHQIWSRDELITALGLPAKEQLAIIDRYLATSLRHGELPTFIGADTTCADGVGWLLLLIREFGLEKLGAHRQEKVMRFCHQAIEQLNQDRKSEKGLIWSESNATWMDTIGRAGCRLEIQCMYALLLELSGNPEHANFQAMIRTQLFHDNYLADGLDDHLNLDPTKRPNVFLAYLLQPELLEKEAWTRCFDTILEATKTAWGGLSSIDTRDSRFQPVSTGETNESYHNGDSWFFVNNLAALALKRHEPERYADTIQNLQAASTREILWQGFLGCPGEIASAQNGETWGCGIQGFSAGTMLYCMSHVG